MVNLSEIGLVVVNSPGVVMIQVLRDGNATSYLISQENIVNPYTDEDFSTDRSSVVDFCHHVLLLLGRGVALDVGVLVDAITVELFGCRARRRPRLAGLADLQLGAREAVVVTSSSVD